MMGLLIQVKSGLAEQPRFGGLQHLLLGTFDIFARLGYRVVYLVEEIIHALAILLLGRHRGHRVQGLALLGVARGIVILQH